MAKEIILYNLAPHVTDEDYAKYVRDKKGPFFNGLAGVKKFTLVKITRSQKGEIPYRYVGIVDIENEAEWGKSASSPAFGEFIKEWTAKVADFHILSGEEVY